MENVQGNMRETCQMAARQLADLYPDVEILFVPHASGMLREVIEAEEYATTKHPAVPIARAILEKHANRNETGFVGMAVHNEVRWLGLASTDKMLGVININMDEFESTGAARRAIYHAIWHVMDVAELRTRPEYAQRFRSGPMIPRRSPMNLARINMQADIFSAAMSHFQGEDDAARQLGALRAREPLLEIDARRAEDYPFCIALETTEYAIAQASRLSMTPARQMQYARQIALEVSATFPEVSIRQWWGFSEPAQDMVWRGQGREDVLGCAIFTSEDPYVRAIAHLIQDLTGIVPSPREQLGDIYNAYLNTEQNLGLHRVMIEKALEDAISLGLMEESGQPLFLAANNQNERLADGHILGWCANAMQAAARAFENALSSGVSPDVAARLEFAGTKQTPNWDTLTSVGETIVGQKRGGFHVTLGHVAEICSQSAAFASVLGAIKMTMNDPAYLRKLETANDFLLGNVAPAGPAPSAPAPKAPAPSAPAPVMAPSAPGLGGSAAARQVAAVNHQRAQQQQAASSAKATDEDKSQ